VRPARHEQGWSTPPPCHPSRGRPPTPHVAGLVFDDEQPAVVEVLPDRPVAGAGGQWWSWSTGRSRPPITVYTGTRRPRNGPW
jgi:hypothetical protein